MKNDRQQAIMELITASPIHTQSELAAALQRMGFRVTQATVSRDIRQMRLVKVAAAEGGSRYALPGSQSGNINERMIRMLRDSTLEVAHAGNMVVVKTLSGAANSACEALDSMNWPEVLGSIAGDNTLFMVAGDEQLATVVADRILQLTEQGGKKETP